MTMDAKEENKRVFTPEEIAELKKKKWSELTYEEKRALLPKKLNKIGEWLLSDGEPLIEVVDWDAVME